MRAYSQDLRQRVLRAIDAGHTQTEIAKMFAISVTTIKRYLKQRRETAHIEPKAIPGRPAQKGAALQAGLKEQLEQNEAAWVTWREQARHLVSQDLVFLDETSSHIALTPLYAYAPRGQRAIGKVPRNSGANMTLLASLSMQGMGEALILMEPPMPQSLRSILNRCLPPVCTQDKS